ncbi:MAG: hypothetical protein Q9191_003001 [Dirinaria sp. TL-2023a]
MHRHTVGLEVFSTWASFNDVRFEGLTITEFPGKAYGLIATAERNGDNPLLMTVPKDLILSLENVWVLAKADKHLRDVLEAVGDYARYVQMLPSKTNVPTFWSENERSAIQGTSLEAALESKLSSLDREFAELRAATSPISWCRECWWDEQSGCLTAEDWKLVDAWYRSRALDLPGTGHAMVPCIDMANHSSGENTTALYDTDKDGNGVLVLREGKSLQSGEEITITYGDEKGACEMLFSYGFLEEDMPSAHELFLDLNIEDDDPLKHAKKALSKSAPGFRLFYCQEVVQWEGPFVWLLCINEEDGLQFDTLQKLDGSRELHVSWQGNDMSDLSTIERFLKEDARWMLFQLRATVVLRDRVEKQLHALNEGNGFINDSRNVPEQMPAGFRDAAKLRDLEETLMLQAYQEFEDKIIKELVPSDVVQQYLGLAAQDNEAVLDDDFS